VTILEFESSVLQDEAGVSQAVEAVLSSSQKQLLVLVAGMGKTEQRLQNAGEKSAGQDLVLASTVAEGVRTLYMQVARQLTSQSVWSETQNLLSSLFEEVSSLLQGIFLMGEISSQGGRILRSYAEQATCVLVAQGLKGKAVQAQLVYDRQVYLTNSAHVSQSFQEKTIAGFQQELSVLSKGGTIPIIPFSLQSIAKTD